MNEKQLENRFLAFLIELGFPRESLLTQVPLVSSNGKRYQPDLLIMDTEIDEYVGLIEFKPRFDNNISNDSVSQVLNYLILIGSKSTPAFIVTPLGDNDFSIFQLVGDEKWKVIDKFDFPSLGILSTKKQIEEKQYLKELERIKQNREYQKIKKVRQTSAWILTSTIIGIIVSIIIGYVSQKGFVDLKNTKFDSSIDSTAIRIFQVENELLRIQNAIKISTVIDTIMVIDSSKTYKGLNDRLVIIEKGISNNPERTLSIINLQAEIFNIKQSIEHFKELEKEKTNSIESRLNYLNGWILGIVIAIFSAALGLFVINYRKENTASN